MAFARNPGRVMSRDQLNHAIAGHDAELYGRGVDMHIGRLRRKIEPDPNTPRFILTVSGAGYKFAAGSAAHRRRTQDLFETAGLRGQAEAEPALLDGISLAGVVPERTQRERQFAQFRIGATAADCAVL